MIMIKMKKYMKIKNMVLYILKKMKYIKTKMVVTIYMIILK